MSEVAQKDFKTQYTAGFSSGGALQNEIIPPHIDTIIILLDSMSSEPSGMVNIINLKEQIMGLRNKIRTQFIVHKQGFRKPETIQEKLNIINKMIYEWGQMKTKYPSGLIEMLYKLAEDFFFQWNQSGAGVIFIPHDAGRKKKIYDAIVGNK